MGILDFLMGEFIDVIHWVDDTQDTMVWRFEREGHAIKYGAKLTVREGQAAVFVHEGQIADVFTPGLYLLETNNMPILTTLNSWDHGFKSPFKSEIYFINTKRFTDLKWGTKNPILCRDAEFGPVRLRAFGTYEVKVSDPARFLVEIVGTDGEFTTDEISYQIRNIIVSNFSAKIAQSGIPVLEMAGNALQLGKVLVDLIKDDLAAYGLSLPALYIENISLPEKVEEVLDKRTSMGIIGDLSTYTQFQLAEALDQKGAKGGSGEGALATGLGAGLGMMMANQMAPQMARPSLNTPPPLPPVEHPWHVAENGATKGPFSRAEIGRMAADGSLKRETLVWTAGQDGWLQAEDVPELATLFTVMPPPPPPPQ